MSARISPLLNIVAIKAYDALPKARDNVIKSTIPPYTIVKRTRHSRSDSRQL